jgi:predicted exporter
MLPRDKDIALSMRFLRQSHFSDKAIVSLGLNSEAHTTSDLILAADKFCAELKSPLITKVTLGISGDNPQEQIIDFLKFAPQLITPVELIKSDNQLNAQGVNAALKSNYHKLLTPGGTFMMPFIRLDPLGIKTGILRNLSKISNALGYNIIVEDGHFLSPDKRHTLLIINTNIPLTDGFGARKLVNFLQEKIKSLPVFVSGYIIAGHMHAVSNEDIIKKDIQRTVTIAIIAFLIVFLATFKDLRALIFLIIPLGAVAIAMNFSAFVFGKLSYFIVGLGAVIIGVADDYGIHAYVAVHTKGRRDAVGEIAKPLVIAALTTISVFATFFFSSVKGYHQLALFAITSIILCLLFVLLIFPHFLKEHQKPDKRLDSNIKVQRLISDKACIWLWVLAMVILIGFSLKTKFNSDISQFDGSKKEIISVEEEFKETYGRQEQPAILVVSVKGKENALERNEEIYLKAVSLVGEKEYSTFTSLWPSLKRRKANVLFWEKFWRGERQDKLELLLSRYSARYNFSSEAFAPFFANLYTGMKIEEGPDNLELFQNIKERFIQEDEGSWQVFSFFPDKDEFINPLIKLSKDNPGVFIVSRKAFSKAVSNSITREILSLSFIAGILVLILTVALLKDIKLTLISLLSVASAIIAILGTFAIFRIPINAAAVIASMMVVGLCIDYGVFMLYSFRHKLNTGTVKAIWVSALTTLIGAFSLLFAKHPILFSIGLTLVAGLFSGYISSQTVIPALYRIFVKEKG